VYDADDDDDDDDDADADADDDDDDDNNNNSGGGDDGGLVRRSSIGSSPRTHTASRCIRPVCGRWSDLATN